MLERVIEWAVRNTLIVLLFTFAAVAGGIWALKSTPLEALPDLSDVQVIVEAQYSEQAPRIVEDQVTYPITAEMLKVPGARTVRGYSFFGVSFVYVIFEDGTDLYWARSRVLEYLNGITGKLPASVTPSLGPDATGLGCRIAALATELRKFGAEVEERADGLTITPRPLTGCAVDTYNDHRMAMSLALVGLKVPGVVVRDPGCVAKTYPGFWKDLDVLRK